MVAYRKGDYAAAGALIDRAVAAHDGDARLWFNRGLAYAAGGRAGDAKVSFERVLALEPGHGGAAQWLARLAA